MITKKSGVVLLSPVVKVRPAQVLDGFMWAVHVRVLVSVHVRVLVSVHVRVLVSSGCFLCRIRSGS